MVNQPTAFHDIEFDRLKQALEETLISANKSQGAIFALGFLSGRYFDNKTPEHEKKQIYDLINRCKYSNYEFVADRSKEFIDLANKRKDEQGEQ